MRKLHPQTFSIHRTYPAPADDLSLELFYTLGGRSFAGSLEARGHLTLALYGKPAPGCSSHNSPSHMATRVTHAFFGPDR